MSDTLRCPNCSQVLYGQYCSRCGQNQKGSDRYLLTLINEAFEGVFSLNSKAWRTTFSLFFRPGFLTKEHFAHRRARYVSPLRLYLITSISFFLLLSLINLFSNEPNLNSEIDEQIKSTQLDRVVETDSQSTESENVPSTSEISDNADAESEAEAEPILTYDEIIEQIPTLELSIPFVSQERQLELNQALTGKLKGALLLGKQRPRKVLAKVIDTAPPIIFSLLPIFALILKLVYLRRRRFYTEHLVLSLHNHSFLFSVMTLITLSSAFATPNVDAWLSSLLGAWLMLYMVLSLKHVFAQSWPKTLLKSGVLFMAYVFFLSIAFFLMGLLGIILL